MHRNSLVSLITSVLILGCCENAFASQLLAGYQCMNVRMTQAQAADPNFMLVVQTGPSPTAPALGTIGYTMIVADPVVSQNGYIQVTRADRSVGWVPASAIKPWLSANLDPHVRCQPEILDNGRVGFITK